MGAKPNQQKLEQLILNFEKLRDRVLTTITEKHGSNKWYVPLYRNEGDNGFNLHGDGSLSFKLHMMGGEAGECTPEDIWDCYKEYFSKITKAEAVHLAIKKFEEILEERTYG
ncbi:hypothetical protein HY490_00025 [Candidatus Woesearchaeota archaeon]|nr:hypothetical protein [Candidatus Woesearchaeota archaeon]